MQTPAATAIFALDTTQLRAWAEGLLHAGRRVVAPVLRGGLATFRPLRAGAEWDLYAARTPWSPKEFLFPRSEELFRYRTSGDTVTLSDPALPSSEQVLLSVRPCDARGLLRLDAVLMPDPSYAHRRALTTVVVQACADVQPECFCAAVGGSPGGSEGADVLLAEHDGGWLLRPLTERGEALVAAQAPAWPTAPDSAWDAAMGDCAELAARSRGARVPADAARLLEASFDSPQWEEIARTCLGCSVCTYVCPSCTCFDVVDEGSAACGSRCRTWDSCSYAMFTKHGGGHNPRASQTQRFRQRVLHKFAYFPEKHGGLSMCVGCGRCVRSCPVGLDIQSTVGAVLRRAAQTKADEETTDVDHHA